MGARLLFASFLISFVRIASGYLLVPCRMERTCPRLADCTAGHGVKGSGLADRAQINVDEDSPQHDYGREVIEHIADGKGHAAKITRASCGIAFFAWSPSV